MKPRKTDTRFVVCADGKLPARVLSDHDTLTAATLARSFVRKEHPRSVVRVGHRDPSDSTKWVTL